MIFERLLQSLVALALLMTVVFFLGRLSGDPVMLLAPVDATPQDIMTLRASLGLDQPLVVQYAIFLRKVLTGDFGRSLMTRTPATELFFERFPNSFRLAAVALFIALVLSFPLGILGAVKRGSGIDTVAEIISVLGQAMPLFWLGILLIQIFADRLQVLPTSGMGGPDHYILPGFTAALFLVAGLTRLLRSSILDILNSDFVIVARAKGLSEIRVVWKHVLRNALIPVITFGAMYFAIMISNLVVVETVFAWPGIGRLAYEAITRRDFPVVQVVVIFGAAFVLVADLLADVAYGLIDPRIRY